MCPADPPSCLLQDAFMVEAGKSSLDAEIVKEATGIFVESCRSGAVGAPDSAPKEMEPFSGHHVGRGS